MICLLLSSVGGNGPLGHSASEAAEADGRHREFAPGIRIDWPNRLVELDARVVLHEGALELLACSPNTREHESIVAVQARPRDIYHAMGLVGLEPGSPIRYDRGADRVHPPTGQRLQLHVRYKVNGIERTVPAEEWLFESKRRRSPESVKWVFAGSKSYGDGRFGADVEGTVVCVVDFQTALIAIGASHTADNRFLWLQANTARIPPIGTPCTLVVAGFPERVINLEIDATGTLRHGQRVLSAKEVVGLARRTNAEISPAMVALHPTPGVAAETTDSVIHSLVRAGLDRRLIQVPVAAQADPTPVHQPKRSPDG